MRINLYLDDIRSMPFGFHVQAYNYDECIYWLKTHEIDTLSLDHDLGENPDFSVQEKTGYDVIKWIEMQHVMNARGFSLPSRILVHSANPVGRQNIQRVIDRLYRK